MVVEYIRYKVDGSQRSAFLESYEKASEHLNNSPYCTRYEVTECEEDPVQFMVRIEWTSTEEHMNGFRKSNEFREFYAHVKPFFANIQEMRHYKLTGIHSEEPG